MTAQNDQVQKALIGALGSKLDAMRRLVHSLCDDRINLLHEERQADEM